MNTDTRTGPPCPRILFVDDSRLMRVCAERILAPRFDLILAQSAEQAWQILQRDARVGAVFTDLHMGGMSGFDLLQRIRACRQPHLIDLPVVVVTGDEDGEARRKRALMLGATDFIAKPLHASELLARASAYARSGQSARRLRLLEQAHHIDPETGLGNRRCCEERLIQAMSFAHRHRQPLTMVHLRLEGLARLLDELGPVHGARALARIGQVLDQQIRCEDTVFRTGAETFSFLLPATDSDSAENLKRRFLPDLAELGLCSNDRALAVRVAFVVQAVPALGGHDGARVLADGLAGRVRTTAARRATAAAPDIEQALEMIARGQEDLVRPHAGQLKQRLQPLLAVIAAADAGHRRGAAGAASGKPH